MVMTSFHRHFNIKDFGKMCYYVRNLRGKM